MDPQGVLLAAIGLLAAGVVKGGSGLGYSTCALPFLVPVVGLKPAMIIVIVPAIATNFSVAVAAGHFRETCQRFFPFYLATLPGIGFGGLLMSFCDAAVAVRSLGVVLVAYAGFVLATPSLTLPEPLAGRLQGVAGFANGIITGLTGSQVMPLLPYMMALGLDPDRFVQAVNVSVLLSSAVLAAMLVLSGAVAPEWLVLSLAATVPALVGVRLGTSGRRYISAAHFRTVVIGILAAMGVMLMLRA